jgi:lipoprotein-releasing system ATP-binding protein
MLILKNIYKNYGSLAVLKGVALTVAPGEVVALVGKSGAGKTTLLQIAGTLDMPDSGEVIFNNQVINTFSASALARFRNQMLGFVFQFHHLLPEFSALENVMMPALIAGKPLAPVHTQARALLELVGLSDRSHHYPNALSGGEQQRVAVARALMNQPKIVLADEPTGNLDTANSQQLFELFLQISQQQQVAFLIATHNDAFARQAHRCFRMIDGKISDQTGWGE